MGVLAQPSLRLKSILVPIDFSKSSQKAFEYALPLARQFGGAITLLHAIEPPPYAMDLSYIPRSEGFPTASIKKELAELGNRMIDTRTSQGRACPGGKRLRGHYKHRP